MRNRIPFLAGLVLVGLIVGGCANSEKKLGRGLSNSFEIVRMGEFRRTFEQSCLFDGPNVGYTRGAIHGLNRSLARTGIGLYEVLTSPFPPYDPIFTDYFAPGPVFPDNFQPSLIEDPSLSTDTNLGFSGGDIAPFVPNSRFRVFETH